MARSSYLMAEDPQNALAILTAMADELEYYLTNDELYHTLIVRAPGGDQNLKMTIGDMLTRVRQLQNEDVDLQSLKEKIAAALTQIDVTRRELHTRMQERMAREVASRLNNLQWFLDDCVEDQQRCRIDFPFEMRNRQRIEELMAALDGRLDETNQKRLEAIDTRIRQMTRNTDFLWDERLKSIFPPAPYWYLYVSP